MALLSRNGLSRAQVEALVSAGGGGGSGDTYPMNPYIWYDNRTAMAGTAGTPVTIEPDTIAAALVRITDPDAALTGVSLYVDTYPLTDATARFALYAVAETGASRGLPGAKLADLGTVVVDAAASEEAYAVTPDVSVAPGYYWLAVSASEECSVLGWEATGGLLGLGAQDDENPRSGVVIAVTGAHETMPATLAGVVTLGERVRRAPQVFFQVTPA